MNWVDALRDIVDIDYKLVLAGAAIYGVFSGGHIIRSGKRDMREVRSRLSKIDEWYRVEKARQESLEQRERELEAQGWKSTTVHVYQPDVTPESGNE